MRLRRYQKIVSYRRRHPFDRAPFWLNDLAEDILYWLRKTSRLRHSHPFNKRKAGKLRRDARKFKRNARLQADAPE